MMIDAEQARRIALGVIVWSATIATGTTTPITGTPPAMLEVMPGTMDRLRSRDISERVAVLEELVRVKDREIVLPSLPRDQWVTVLRAVLVDDLQRVEPEVRNSALVRACYVIQAQQLRELAGPITVYLRSDDASEVVMALRTIAALDAPTDAAELAPLLEHPMQSIRRDAAAALVRQGAPEVVPYLLRELEHEESLRRYEAILGLTQVGDRAVAPALARHLTDPHKDNRAWALLALAKLDAREQAAAIWPMLDADNEASTKTLAIAALVKLGEARAIPLAVERATSNDRYRPNAMLDALIRTGATAANPALIEALDPAVPLNINTRALLMRHLARVGETGVIPVLRRYATGAEHEVARTAAVEALGDLRAHEAVDDLLPLLRPATAPDEEPSYNARSFAADAAIALAKIGERRTWPALVHFAENAGNPKRGVILGALNEHMNPDLWKKLNETRVKGYWLKPLHETAAGFTEQSGVAIVMHYPPDPPDAPTFANTGNGTLLRGVAALVEACGKDGSLASQWRHTFVLDGDTVHVMPAPDAVAWWKRNALTEPVE